MTANVIKRMSVPVPIPGSTERAPYTGDGDFPDNGCRMNEIWDYSSCIILNVISSISSRKSFFNPEVKRIHAGMFTLTFWNDDARGNFCGIQAGKEA
jgi:hypothetical protein